jgi:hypothetical protein
MLGLAVWLLLVAPELRAGLIINGNFEQGNTGFTTQYLFSPGDIGPALSYEIVSNPALSRPNDINPVSYVDHTTGSGLMMAVNGADVSNTLVWSQCASVNPNTDYDFSFWVSSWFGPPVAQLDVLFNGISVGTPFAPSTTAVWEEFSTTWKSGIKSSLTIQIRMTNGADIGRDFALDDIMLTRPQVVPEPSSLVLCFTMVGCLLGYRTLRWGTPVFARLDPSRHWPRQTRRCT